MYSRNCPVQFVDAAWASLARYANDRTFAGSTNGTCERAGGGPIIGAAADSGNNHSGHNSEARTPLRTGKGDGCTASDGIQADIAVLRIERAG